MGMDYKYEISLSVNGTEIDMDMIRLLFGMSFKGDKLLVEGDASKVSICYQTNEPWKVMEYCATFGDMYGISVKNLQVE